MLIQIQLSHAGFVVDKLTLGQVFLQELCFPLSVLYHQCSVCIHWFVTNALYS